MPSRGSQTLPFRDHDPSVIANLRPHGALKGLLYIAAPRVAYENGKEQATHVKVGSEQAVHTLTGTRDSPLLLYGFTALPLALARIAGGRGIEAGRGEREARAQGRGRKTPDMCIYTYM